MEQETRRTRFLLKNLLRALVYAVLLAVAYLLFKEYIIEENKAVWIERFYGNPLVIYLIYIGSEIFFGLFPPEFFMLWAFNKGDYLQYIANVAFFAVVSYGAGYLAFLIGRFLRQALFFRYMSRKFFKHYWPLFRRYGSLLIIVAALTPLPWAAVSMLVGSTEYPMKRFLLIALFRIFRFAFYGYIIFQTHLL